MLFNSLAFAIFLPTVFAIYWLLGGNRKAQNLVIVAASCVFYGWWDVRFLFLLLFSTALDFYTGLRIQASQERYARRTWLWISVGINLGFLGVFKYYNFFITGFSDLLAAIGIQTHPPLLDVMLPVGISFYTFHGLSYVIDIYNRRIEAERNFVDYSVFVSFFALLVAGPIERATHLLPQVLKPRVFDEGSATDGLRQMLWGFFKKVVIADNCAPVVNDIFAHPGWHTADTLALGAVLFAFQIYGDFSGYSDIAIGCARLFGFSLLRNFAYPYFSRDIAEFWRRWHISLSSWFRDYVYVPLGGSHGPLRSKLRNVLVIFLLSGFWHGANWTFIVWGAINGLLFLPLLLRGKNRKHDRAAAVVGLKDLPAVLFTFACTVIAWIFFRADDLTTALTYLRGMASSSLFGIPEELTWWLAVLIAVLIVVEWSQRTRPHGLEVSHLPPWQRRVAYTGVFLLIFFFGRFSESTFIYFQF
jgi:D-alanyl-lipoteichoic acid acyltransferase DltB (MBOAT superfamily)